MVSDPSINLQDSEELLIQIFPKINKSDELNPCLFSLSESLRMPVFSLRVITSKVCFDRNHVQSQSAARDTRNLDQAEL